MELIQGVMLKPLRVIPDHRGRLMEILRNDDEIFSGFGQVYLSTTLPGVVKGWHRHMRQTDHICCVAGMIRLVIHDDRSGSASQGRTNEFYMGIHQPVLVKVPPLLYHGWQCTSAEEAYVINTVTVPYDYVNPDENRLEPHAGHFGFDWTRRDG